MSVLNFFRRKDSQPVSLPTPQPQRRVDTYSNVLTGIGMAQYDARMSTRFSADRTLTRAECAAYYRSEGIARRIVELPANEMTREWLDVDGDTDGLVLSEHSRLGVKSAFRDMIRWSKAFGGSLCVMGSDDGQTLDQPLYEAGLRKIHFLQVFDRWRVQWQSSDIYSDPRHPRFGQPQTYQVTPITGSYFRVHESRCLKLDGQALPDLDRQNNQGWGDSVYQALHDRLRMLGAIYADVEVICDKFIQGVLKSAGIKDADAMGDEGTAMITQKMQMLDMAMHLLNTVLIDKDEEYTRIVSSVAGLPEIIDRFAQAVSSVSGIPITLLMGRSPAGLNATGDSDIRNWYDKVSSEQEEALLDPVNQLNRLIYLQKDGPFRGKIPAEGGGIIFRPLWQMSDKETADLRKTVAETDAIYLANGVLDPDEVAASRFGGDTYSMETSIDAEARGNE